MWLPLGVFIADAQPPVKDHAQNADEQGDGEISLADFVRVLRGFDTTATEEYRNVVDINEDGVVNVIDLGFVKANIEK